MIDGSAVVGVFSVYVAGVVSPGPNFVAVAHKAASATRIEALAMVAGIVLVNLFWASCAILGVGIVFAAFPWLALVVRIVGACYLLWFGGRLIFNASAARQAVLVKAPAGGFRQAFAQGFATNIANPKSMAFFAAVFSSAAPAHVSTGTFAAMLGMVFVVASSWYGFVALALSHQRIASAYRRGKMWVDRVCGGLIVALGVRQLIR
ncbi:threonine/homoserine/homoserine lactone efflux protein [Paraburkholderia sp. HC6.4b]|uniref:LysE family translocator n=1 Tax=unclassified Paraburkholderia TaxID=2615204 RepID=UPI00161AF7A2|nr:MULTISPECIES: LysE family translocator [unclassified Paraburkholderia]MBB5406901.1 threonine/homoserine/homoserine lactone efflux protein [Paraburkholderia sp. HC6.4b]MBB5449030.1 threonine/homoserine/homoserine lactone efflux protein [Paraburkholderia sp. Kb1A]